jgi:hypothetical protein
MNKSTVGFAAALLLSSSLQAQTVEQQTRDKIAPASSTLCHTYTGAPVVSISREGNVLLFQGADSGDHIYREGYALCNTGSAARYSTNFGDVGFGTASCTCRGASCTVTRNTSDGRLRLTQLLTKPAGLNRSFDIKMTVQNVGGGTVSNVVLRRLATVDIKSAISEWHESTRDSSTGFGTKSAGIPYAVTLRHITRSPTSITYEAKTPVFNDNTCSPADQSASGPVFGDYDSTVQYGLGSLGPSASKTVTVQYLRD